MQHLSSIKKYFSLLISALKGSEKDFTTGSVDKAIFLLAIPMIAEMIMEGVFAVVDLFFVSKISINAVATVGFTESLLMIVYSVAVGMSMATTAVVARRVGEKEYQRAANAGFQSILLASLVGLVIGGIGFAFASDLLSLMGGTESLIQEGVGFTRIMFLGNISIMLLFLINAIFRGAGDASIAMRSLWLANGLNIILDPLLIFGWGPIPAFGIEGAAIATTIGRSIGVIYQLIHLINGSSIIKITWQNFVIKIKTIMELIRVSIAGTGQFLVETASWIFLVRLMSVFGTEAVAGYQIAFRVIVFTILPAWGLSNAAATLVGQNLGAGDPGRAERSVWRTARFTMIFLGLVSLIFMFFSVPIVTLFNADNQSGVLDVGVRGLQIICLGYLFFAYGMVISQAFNGAGDTRTPLWVNFFVFWIIQIPLAYWLAVILNWQAEGVFTTIALCHSLQAVISIFLFKRGKWKLVQV